MNPETTEPVAHQLLHSSCSVCPDGYKEPPCSQGQSEGVTQAPSSKIRPEHNVPQESMTERSDTNQARSAVWFLKDPGHLQDSSIHPDTRACCRCSCAPGRRFSGSSWCIPGTVDRWDIPSLLTRTKREHILTVSRSGVFVLKKDERSLLAITLANTPPL